MSQSEHLCAGAIGKRSVALLTTLVVATVLTACGDSGDSAESTADSSAMTSATSDDGSASDATLQGSGDIKLESGTVRAKAAADTPDGRDMTAIFGVLHNTSDVEISITGFHSSLGEAAYEIHETVDGVMREKPGGITIPAGGEHALEPGGDHFMIMGYRPEIPAGEQLVLILESADGEEFEIPHLAVRTMQPGDEDYAHDGSLAGHEGPSGHGDDADTGGHEGHEGHATH